MTATNIGQVAEYTSIFLAYLIGHVGVSDRDVHLIGHSLGGHLVGFTGDHLILDYEIEIGRITGRYFILSKQFLQMSECNICCNL